MEDQRNTSEFEEAYFIRASEAFIEKDYKQCLVLLKHVEINDIERIQLLVNCSYEFWRTVVVDIKDESVRKPSLDLLMNSYTTLLGTTDPALVDSYEYIRLSHIYLGEGSLDGALKIIQLACARGHLEDLLVVTQSWTILTRLDKIDEAENAINYLCSAVILVPRPTNADTTRIYIDDSPLDLGFMYMHCASFLRNKLATCTNAYIHKKLSELYNTLIAEGYFMDNGCPPADANAVSSWFNNPEVWFRMGRWFSNTPFILLAEQSYWECLLCNPLDGRPVEAIMHGMRRSKRISMLFEFLLKVNKLFPANTYTRECLMDMEIELSGVAGPFANRFLLENQRVVKAQAQFRRFRITIHWEAMKQHLLDTKERHYQCMLYAEKKHVIMKNTLLRSVLKWWKSYGRYLRLLQRRAAAVIQAHYRRHVAKKWTEYMRFRVSRANALFVVAADRSYEFTRLRALREWYNVYEQIRKQKAAKVIADTLRNYGFSKKFYDSMDFVCKAIRIHRKYSNKRTYELWRIAFRRRQITHAKTTIRFFVRDCVVRSAQRKAEAKLKRDNVVERAAKYQYKVYQKPLMIEIWENWRYSLQLLREHKARVRVAKLLPILYRRKLARAKLRKKRIRKEAMISFVRKTYFKRHFRIFNPWKRNAFARIIQRMVRCYFARKKLRRLKNCFRNMRCIWEQRKVKTKERTLYRWNKHNYLVKREKHRASKRIVKFFRYLKLRRFLRGRIQKRYNSGEFAYFLHLIVAKHFFKHLECNTVKENRFKLLFQLFQTVRIGALRILFAKWRYNSSAQVLALRLREVLIHRRLDQEFWKQCYYALQFSVLKNRIEFEHAVEDPYAKPVFTSELTTPYTLRKIQRTSKFVTLEKRLMSIKQQQLYKAMKSWIVAFQYHCRLRCNASPILARVFMTKLFVNLNRRQDSMVLIQRQMRLSLARRQFAELLRIHRRLSEKSVVISTIRERRTCRQLFSLVQRRILSRIRIQCLFRVAVAKHRFEEIKLKHEFHNSLSDYIRSLAFNKQRIRRVFAKMQFVYLHQRVVQRLTDFWKLIKSVKAISKKTTTIDKYLQPPKRLMQSNSFSGLQLQSTTSSNVLSAPKKRFSSSKPLRATKSLRSLSIDSGDGSNSSVRSKDADGSSIHSMLSGDSTDLLADLAEIPLSEMINDYQSQAFYNSAFRLKQSGIFIAEGNVSNMTAKELIYLVARADTVFVQGLHPDTIEVLARYFLGRKIVFFGGIWSISDMKTLCSQFSQRVSELSVEVLHLNETKMSSLSSVLFSQFLRLASTSSLAIPATPGILAAEQEAKPAHLTIREVFIDSTSCGVLGIASVMMSLSLSSDLRILIVKCDHRQWPLALAEVLNRAQFPSLVELRFFGSPLPALVLEALANALRNQLSELYEVEMSVDSRDSAAMMWSERVIQSGKERLYRGKKGVSIKVNSI